MLGTSSAAVGGNGSEVVVIMGLLVVQVIYGSFSVILSSILSSGLDPLFLVYAGNVVIFFVLLPFAVAFERRKWPEKLSLTLLVHFGLISFGGVTAFQVLLLMGIEKTSPAIASAMPNLAPGLIFVIACCIGFEKVELKCIYSRAKIMGTLMCLSGVIAMSLLQTPQMPPATLTSHGHTFLLDKLYHNNTDDTEWIIGCIYLFSAVFIVSCTMVLQAATLAEFPAPLSLTAITSLMGATLTATVQLVVKGKLDVGYLSISIATLSTYITVSSAISAICMGFQMWCIKKRGPVLVSMFSPVGTVSSAVLSALMLGKLLSPGSLAGMVVMFMGLYAVLWAKNKEASVLPDHVIGDKMEVDDIEKPMLS